LAEAVAEARFEAGSEAGFQEGDKTEAEAGFESGDEAVLLTAETGAEEALAAGAVAGTEARPEAGFEVEFESGAKEPAEAWAGRVPSSPFALAPDTLASYWTHATAAAAVSTGATFDTRAASFSDSAADAKSGALAKGSTLASNGEGEGGGGSVSLLTSHDLDLFMALAAPQGGVGFRDMHGGDLGVFTANAFPAAAFAAAGAEGDGLARLASPEAGASAESPVVSAETSPGFRRRKKAADSGGRRAKGKHE
jgi:hypothetical protein